jgi:hypothetical protein
MSNMKTIKLVDRPVNGALDTLSNDQMVHMSELALEHC